MRNPLLAPELRELLQEKRHAELRQIVDELHPKDAASILSGLEDDEIVEVMSLLPLEMERDLFEYFEPDVQESIVVGSGRDRLKGLMAALPSDERYELMERLDDRVRAQLMPLLPADARQDLMRREQFEDDQVGAFMSIEYCVLSPHRTAPEAIKELRRQEPRKETIYYSYVVDADRKLIGFLSLRDLVVAKDDLTVGDLMRTDPISVTTTDDQERAAQLIRDYDLLALPVTDTEGRLVGIVTHDDAVDILEEEETEDIERMAGIAGEAEAESYTEESVLSQIRRRGPLIFSLAIFFTVTASVITSFEDTLNGSHKVVMALLPMVMATGGMVGTQSSSLIIRALTVGDLVPRAIATVLWKELRISLGMGFVLSSIVFAEGMLLGALDPDDRFASDTLLLACVGMSIAMMAHVISAVVFGASIPMLTRAMKGDPAMVSTPAVTAIADLSGATLYLLSITWLVPLAASGG